MAMRPSVARVVGAAAFPLICLSTTAYFAYFTVWGERGLLARSAAETQLAAAEHEYETAKAAREHLQRRIDLVRRGDPDMVEELRRNQLLGTAPGEVLVPRSRAPNP